MSVADLGDVLFNHLLEHPKALDEIEAVFAKIKAHNIIPLSAGGDHTISLPILRALAKDRPVGMIHIDAHTDTWDMFQGSKFSHGSPFRNATEEGLLDPKRVIQIGISRRADDGRMAGTSPRRAACASSIWRSSPRSASMP